MDGCSNRIIYPFFLFTKYVISKNKLTATVPLNAPQKKPSTDRTILKMITAIRNVWAKSNDKWGGEHSFFEKNKVIIVHKIRAAVVVFRTINGKCGEVSGAAYAVAVAVLVAAFFRLLYAAAHFYA